MQTIQRLIAYFRDWELRATIAEYKEHGFYGAEQ
jgi:hypothetical protein